MNKRTPEQAKSFFKRFTKTRGEGRELYKTPIDVIDKIVCNLLRIHPELRSRTWIDPCAGDGRWQNIIEKYGIECISYDLLPLNNEVKQMDFLSNNIYPKNTFFIGNPPFSLLKKFVKKALSITDSCYFLGGSQIITGALSEKVRMLNRFEGFESNQKDKRSKIKFLDTNNKQVLVWCCGALFDNEKHSKFIQTSSKNDFNFRVSIKNYCENDVRVITIKKVEE